MGAFGDMVKEAREKKGLTQAEVAAALGVTQPAVNQWELGGGSPENYRLSKLGALLGLNVAWLLEAIAADAAATPAKDLTPQSPAVRRRKRGREP